MFSPTKNTSFQSHTPREFWEVQKSRREIPAHRLTSDTLKKVQFSSVHFSCSFVSDSLRHHESQHTRPPCPSPTPRVHLNSRPSSQWCHPAFSSSVIPFSSCPHSLPASESFPMSQLFAWGGQCPGVSALASFLPKNTQGWSHMYICIYLFNTHLVRACSHPGSMLNTECMSLSKDP